jgi:hypothetical protein
LCINWILIWYDNFDWLLIYCQCFAKWSVIDCKTKRKVVIFLVCKFEVITTCSADVCRAGSPVQIANFHSIIARFQLNWNIQMAIVYEKKQSEECRVYIRFTTWNNWLDVYKMVGCVAYIEVKNPYTHTYMGFNWPKNFWIN